MANKIHKGKIARETSRTLSTDAVNPTDAIALGQVEGLIAGVTATGTALNLSKVSGTNYNYATPSTATTYTTTSPVINGFARCFINAATEPTITGATKILGNDFTPNVVMEMVVESPNGTAVEFYFVER